MSFLLQGKFQSMEAGSSLPILINWRGQDSKFIICWWIKVFRPFPEDKVCSVTTYYIGNPAKFMIYEEVVFMFFIFILTFCILYFNTYFLYITVDSWLVFLSMPSLRVYLIRGKLMVMSKITKRNLFFVRND